MTLNKISYLSQDSLNLYRVSKDELLISLLLVCFSMASQAGNQAERPPLWLFNACEQLRLPENFTQGLPKFIELSGKSQEHLTRMMKKYYNATPTEYCNSVRLDQVCYLLKTTDRSVLDIMLACGFQNVSHFNKQFRQMYGITPSVYRSHSYSVINIM